jgi:hypothetical protein
MNQFPEDDPDDIEINPDGIILKKKPGDIKI